MIKMKECGLIEVVDILMGHPMYSFDSSHVQVNTNSSSKRDRVLKKKNDQVQITIQIYSILIIL